jgi:hypothetical protein
MPGHLNPLQRAFLEDHRHLTRGLTNIVGSLERGDEAGARREADILDRNVGPHMAFEEQVFYPELSRILGPEPVSHLYEDHDVGKHAVQKLLEGAGAGTLGEQERTELLADLRGMLEHAEGCGTLLSHLEGLRPERLERLMAALVELRSQGIRWTELPTSAGT